MKELLELQKASQRRLSLAKSHTELKSTRQIRWKGSTNGQRHVLNQEPGILRTMYLGILGVFGEK